MDDRSSTVSKNSIRCQDLRLLKLELFVPWRCIVAHLTFGDCDNNKIKVYTVVTCLTPFIAYQV